MRHFGLALVLLAAVACAGNDEAEPQVVLGLRNGSATIDACLDVEGVTDGLFSTNAHAPERDGFKIETADEDVAEDLSECLEEEGGVVTRTQPGTMSTVN